MFDRTAFSADEWKKVVDGVLSAGIAVSMADPHGLFGLLQEGFANAKDLASIKSDANASPLLRGIVAELETAEGRTAARDGLKARLKGMTPAQAKGSSIAALKEAVTVVASKSPSELAAFKTWVQQTAQHVAEASKEGGFLGIGGVRVSENEKATLAEIAQALG